MSSPAETLAANRQHNVYRERRITEWSDPPPSAAVHQGTRRTSYSALAWELRSQPGRWARLDDRASASAAYQFALIVVRGGRSAFRPAGSFDAAHDGNSVWVRYVGGSDLPPDDGSYADEDQEQTISGEVDRPRTSGAFTF